MPYRTNLKNNQLIVIKIGTNILTTEEGKLDLNNLRHLIFQIADEINFHHRKIIIVTSGAITSGSECCNFKTSTIPEKQAAAAVGQILLMQEYSNFFRLKNLIIAQILLTKDAIENPTLAKNAFNTINTLLNSGIVPIINENDSIATDEIKTSRFGDNDELSTLVAKLINAQSLILLTDTNGLFTSNPKKNPQAKHIPFLSKIQSSTFELIEDTPNTRSRGGMYTKIKAAKFASEHGIDVIIADGRLKHTIKQIFTGSAIGTFIKAQK